MSLHMYGGFLLSQNKKNIFDKLINTLDGMGMGVLATLIVGTILRQIATLLGDGFSLLFTIGSYAQVMMAVGVAIGVSIGAKVRPTVVYGAIVASVMGAGALRLVDGAFTVAVGDPAGAFAATIVAIIAGTLVAGRTKLDIMLTPLVSIVAGGLAAIFISPHVTATTALVGQIVTAATDMHPFLMGIIVSVIFCFIILSPLSSSALAIGLGLSGIAGGAALAGTAASMVGFATISFKDNGIEGLVSQGIGTSKIQFGNFVKRPAILLPTIIAAAITGPASTLLFQIETNSLGAGMGTSGLVGQIQTLYVMGTDALWMIVLAQIVLPIAISLFVYKGLLRLGWIRHGDMVLPRG